MKATSEQARLMAELETEDLRGQIADLRRQIEELNAEAALDACHIAGLSAEIKALIAESEACPNRSAHPLVERVDYIDSRTGQPITKTRALRLYREAFDAEARAFGIDHPEQYRS